MADSGDLRAGMATGAFDAAVRAAEHVHGLAVQRAPIDEGTLRASATLVPIVNGDRYEGSGGIAAARTAVARLARAGALRRFELEVSFNTVYAARQHEELEWEHPKGGQAKYLSSAFAETEPRFRRLVAMGAEVGLRRARG